MRIHIYYTVPRIAFSVYIINLHCHCLVSLVRKWTFICLIWAWCNVGVQCWLLPPPGGLQGHQRLPKAWVSKLWTLDTERMVLKSGCEFQGRLSCIEWSLGDFFNSSPCIYAKFKWYMYASNCFLKLYFKNCDFEIYMYICIQLHTLQHF